MKHFLNFFGNKTSVRGQNLGGANVVTEKKKEAFREVKRQYGRAITKLSDT